MTDTPLERLPRADIEARQLELTDETSMSTAAHARRRALKLERATHPVGHQHPADVTGRRLDDPQKAEMELVARSQRLFVLGAHPCRRR